MGSGDIATCLKNRERRCDVEWMCLAQDGLNSLEQGKF